MSLTVIPYGLPTWAESGALLTEFGQRHPEWWNDRELIDEVLREYTVCVIASQGVTCLEIDPSGPGSCHCMHCNAVDASRRFQDTGDEL